MTDYGTQYDRMYVAIVTPHKDGTYDPDEGQLRKLLRFFLQPEYVEAGIGIIINPEAGEIFYLNREEARKNVQIAVDEIQGKVPLFAGAIAPATHLLVHPGPHGLGQRNVDRGSHTQSIAFVARCVN